MLRLPPVSLNRHNILYLSCYLPYRIQVLDLESDVFFVVVILVATWLTERVNLRHQFHIDFPIIIFFSPKAFIKLTCLV